jgi:predicted murein hydrolase (TIGR00659 family)
VIRNAHETWAFLQASSVTWVVLTVSVYRLAYRIYRTTSQSALANPVLISVVVIMSLLFASSTPYSVYFDGARLVHFFIGPATVAMAVPLYNHTKRLKHMMIPLLAALLIGSITAACSAVLIGRLLGASSETLLALAPKSTTMAVAMGITERMGGSPSLTSLMVTMTGISGAIMARPVLDLVRLDDMAARGFVVGITAHAIGTGYALQVSELAGAFSALGMGLNSIVTTLFVPLLIPLCTVRP